MSWLDALKKEIGDYKLTDGKKIRAAKVAVHPRENVLKLINDNISFFNDKNYKVKTAKGREKTPDSCYKIADGKASVWLSYSKQKLKFDEEHTVIAGIAENKVTATLDCLRRAVESGAFDAQLESIKHKRSDAQRASKVRAPKK
jgi:hypothetical protein